MRLEVFAKAKFYCFVIYGFAVTSFMHAHSVAPAENICDNGIATWTYKLLLHLFKCIYTYIYIKFTVGAYATNT